MSFRNQQVAKELLKAFGRIFQEELPLEHYGLVTVTDVTVTPKLDHVSVFVSAMKQRTRLVEHLNRRAGYLARQIVTQVKLRKIPHLAFKEDLSTERVERIENLLGEQEE
ncbi:MAG: 30S ribosome-binding factor RbfA [bacterium]|nr:30S ribosome-binding factor RbfA [bacterium]